MHFVFARHAPHTQSEWAQICFQSLFTKATAPVQYSGWNANHVMGAYCTTSSTSKGLWPVASPTLWSPRPRRLLMLYIDAPKRGLGGSQKILTNSQRSWSPPRFNSYVYIHLYVYLLICLSSTLMEHSDHLESSAMAQKTANIIFSVRSQRSSFSAPPPRKQAPWPRTAKDSTKIDPKITSKKATTTQNTARQRAVRSPTNPNVHIDGKQEYRGFPIVQVSCSLMPDYRAAKGGNALCLCPPCATHTK